MSDRAGADGTMTRFAPTPAEAVGLDGLRALEAALGTTRQTRVIVCLAVLTVASVVLALGLGPVYVSPADVTRILGHHLVGAPDDQTWSRSQDAIVWDVRTPRVLMGALVGMALGIAGVALQAAVRNPLAEPYVLGVSAGASTGAAAAILFGFGAGLGGHSVELMAFLGALGAMFAVLGLARTGGSITPSRMLIAGVAVGYVLNANTSLLIVFADSAEGVRSVTFWLLGSLSGADWDTVPVAAVVFAYSFAHMWWWRRRLDLIAISDEASRSAGVDPDRTRTALIVVVAMCVGVAVAVSGGIGFVGLAVPHIARRFVGTAHRAVLPAAGLIGALLLVWADVLARTVVQPLELPIGVVTTLVGAPFLIIFVRRLQLSDP